MTIKSAAVETDPSEENYGLPTNRLSFTDIENEFGQTFNRSFGAYRISKKYGAHDQGGGSGSNGLAFPLSTNAGTNADSSIPTSGTIKFSDFYNGKLTCLIDGFTATGDNTLSAYMKSNGSGIVVEGGGTGTITLGFGWNDNPSSSGQAVGTLTVGGQTFSQGNNQSGQISRSFSVTGGNEYLWNITGQSSSAGYRIVESGQRIEWDDNADNGFDVNATMVISSLNATIPPGGSVEYYHGSTINAKSMWNSGNRIRIGEDNIPSPPSSFSTTDPRAKVILYINKVFAGRPSGSTYNNKKYVTVKTGSWTSRTDLHILVGDKGKIFGSGGKGGNAGDGNANGTDGFNGMSAVGANNNVTITIKNGGVIRKGFGGGGGGGGYYTSGKWSTTTQQGGAGGGGAGLTFGNVGAPGGSGHDGDGGTGNQTKDGGGLGRSGDQNAGDGADGADTNAPSPGSAGNGNKAAGSNGANGDAFRKTSGSITVNIFPGAAAKVEDTSVQTGDVVQ